MLTYSQYSYYYNFFILIGKLKLANARIIQVNVKPNISVSTYIGEHSYIRYGLIIE